MTGDLVTSDRAAWVGLSLIPALGGRTLARLLDRFESASAVLDADDAALHAVPGIGPKLAAAIQAVDVPSVQVSMADWQSDGIVIALVGDAAYPPPLAALDDAPPTLFLRGTLAAEGPGVWVRSIAIVGTRRPRPESRQIAGALAGMFAAHGWIVISGLAAGIDTAAHGGALRTGNTAAVLGCGVRSVYPPENRALAGRIVHHGALLSETHPDAPPTSPALVARNRLISGLSRAVIVVETGLTGGSLHTVRFARAQQRPVYTVAGDTEGNRQLIADGALPLSPLLESWERLQEDLSG